MAARAQIVASPESQGIVAELSQLDTLAAVIAWGRSNPERVASQAVISTVIVQDEFSHDALVPLAGGLVAVFGST